jgi:hypothetical protein
MDKRYSLYLMMFFQYLMYAVWWVPLAAYLTNMNIASTKKAFILSSIAVGCITSPVFRMVADRYFSAQKVLEFKVIQAQDCMAVLIV